jgi:hypothetical protein
MKLRYAFAALAFGFAVPAKAEMTVGTFVAKADALKAKGMMAMMSPDIGLLQSEMKAASTAYRARLERDKAAGRAPHSCPPPKGGVKMDSDELIAFLRTLPPKTALEDGMGGMMRNKFPCPAK